MKKSKIIIISLLLVILSLGAASAADMDNDGVINDGLSNDNELGLTENSDLSSGNENATFTDIQTQINDASEDTVELNHSYYSNEEKMTVEINKGITLDGNNAVIDVGDAKTAFYIDADNVILKNLRFVKKTNNTDDTTVIYAVKSCIILNCTFENCHAKNGITIRGDESVSIINSTFKDSSTEPGNYEIISSFKANIENSNFNNCLGKIYIGEGNISNSNFTDCNSLRIIGISDGSQTINRLIKKCRFTNCINENSNGIVTSFNVDESSFENCFAKNGAAISQSRTITDSTFINCKATEHGGAIYFSDIDAFTLKNCRFINSTGSNDEAAYSENYIAHSIEDCEFIDCSDRIFFAKSTLTIVSATTNKNNINITIELDANVTKTIQVKINNDTYEGEMINGVCIFEKENLSHGEKTITAIFDGNEEFLPSNTTTTLTIKKAPEIRIEVDNYTKGETVYVKVYVSEGISQINVRLNGPAESGTTATVENCTCTVPIDNSKNLNAGTYTVFAVYDGQNDTYFADYANATFTILKAYPNLKISAQDIYEGENASFSFVTPEVVPAVLKINDTEHNISVENGMKKVIIPSLTAGTYHVTLIFKGNDNYLPENVSMNLTVYPAKIKTQINLTVESVTVDDKVRIYIQYTNGIRINKYYFDSVPSEGGFITTSENSGYWERNPQPEGTYNITVRFEGDNRYLPCENSTILVVKPRDTRAQADIKMNFTKTYEGEKSVITITASENITSVIIRFNNTDYEVPINNTKGQFTTPVLSRGSHNITLIFKGNEFYKPYSYQEVLNALIKVDPPVSDLDNKTNETDGKVFNPAVMIFDQTFLYTENSNYIIQVYGKDGKVASNVDVVVKLNNKNFKKLKTNSKGQASFKINLKPGRFKITASALGITVSKHITVKSIISLKKVNVKKSCKKLVLTASLAKVHKKYLKNKKVTFKFNNKKYTTRTNAKGVAKVTVKKSVLKKLKVNKKIKIEASFLEDNAVKTIKVKK